MKLQANFHRASPAFLSALPQGNSQGIFTSTADLTTALLSGLQTKFYIIRHNDYMSTDSTPYTWRAETSLGNITIPQLGGALTLNGRDSKIHVVDYNVGGINLIYSSAEVFTWKKSGSKCVLLLYGGLGETHEFAVPSTLGAPRVDRKTGISHDSTPRSQIIQWVVEQERAVVSFENSLDVYLLWRNDAYNYWTLELPASEPLGLYASSSRLNSSNETNSSVIIKAGYLLRNASIEGTRLHLVGDVNATTEIEVISAPKGCCTSISFNGDIVNTNTVDGRMKAIIRYEKPEVLLPNFKTAEWHYLDSLPEIKSGYNDHYWTLCNLSTSNNPRNLTTPTSLYADDYGYHGGSLIYRGHFIANGHEKNLYLQIQGGNAFGYSAWLDSVFLGSWVGDPNNEAYNQTLSFIQQLHPGETYTITIVIDHMGLDENFYVNTDAMKAPRGILDYTLSGHVDQSIVLWKLTGNFGGEHYWDRSRGPLNEGAMFAERQGFHLPGAPIQSWVKKSPFDGIEQAGIGFFATKFQLNMPAGYDIPLSVIIRGSSITTTTGNFRVQVFVNGWQFGKYGMESLHQI